MIFITLLLNQYFTETLGVMRVTLNTSMMLFQVLVLIYIYVEWIFPNPDLDEEVKREEGVLEEENIEEALAEA